MANDVKITCMMCTCKPDLCPIGGTEKQTWRAILERMKSRGNAEFCEHCCRCFDGEFRKDPNPAPPKQSIFHFKWNEMCCEVCDRCRFPDNKDIEKTNCDYHGLVDRLTFCRDFIPQKKFPKEKILRWWGYMRQRFIVEGQR